MQLPALMRLHLLPRPRVSTVPGVRQVGTLLLPAVFSIRRQISPSEHDGVNLGHGKHCLAVLRRSAPRTARSLIAVALGTVMLPHLSRLVTADDATGFLRTVNWASVWA